MAVRPSVIGSPTTFNTSGVNSVSVSHTVVAGTNMLVVVLRAKGQSFGATITSVVWNSLALTRAAAFPDEVSVWYLLAPAITTATLTVTSNGQATVLQGGAHNVKDNDASTPFGSSAGAAAGGVFSAASVSVSPTGSEDMVIGVVAANAGPDSTYFNPGTGVTETFEVDRTAAGQHCAGGTKDGSGSAVVFNWTFDSPTGGGGYESMAIVVKAAAATVIAPNPVVAIFAVGAPTVVQVPPVIISVIVESGATQKLEVAAK